MRYFFVLFFGFLSIPLFAQNIEHSFAYSDKELSIVLEELENVYNIKFSYDAQVVKNRAITLDIESASLSQVISKIQEGHNLLFEKIDERYYIIKRNNSITVCGYLREAVDGNPVTGASITDRSKQSGVVSDSKGFFSMENVKESDTLEIDFLGFKTLKLSARDVHTRKCYTYSLVSENYLLNEVVVQDYLATGISKTKDGAVRVNPNNSDVLFGQSEPDVLQSIQLLPGIESPSETASGLFIRGSTPDQNLVLWDGIKMYNSDHFFGMISAFNPYIAKDVRIYRSGTKSEYGDRISGVIDIKTDNLVPKRLQGGFGINMTHMDGFLKIPLSENIGIMVSSRRSLTDILSTPTFENFSSKVFQNTSISNTKEFFDQDFSGNSQRFYFTDFNFKLIANPSPKDKVSISSLYTKNKLDYAFKAVNFERLFTDDNNIRNMGANTSWNRFWNDKFKTKAQFYYSEYDLEYEGGYPFLSDDVIIKKSNVIKELGASLQVDWQINDKLAFSNGYQFFTNQVSYLLEDEGITQSSNQHSPTHALYTQMTYDQSNTWHFDIGLRANHYGLLNAVFIEPRFYGEKIFGDNFRMKGSAEIKHQAVSQIIEFATNEFGLESQVWALADDADIPLLKSDQFSIGFLYNKKGWNLDMDAYFKNTEGFTALTPGFTTVTDNFPNGSSTTKGIDLLVKKKLNNYSTWVGYTYSDTDFVFDNLNNEKPFSGNNDVTHSFTLSQFYQWKNFQFSLGWRYRTGIPVTPGIGVIGDPGSESVEYGTINSETLPDYHRLDFSALYDFRFSKKENPLKGKFGISLLNLYGQKNVLSRRYSLSSFFDNEGNEINELIAIDKTSLGFTPNIVLRVSF